MTCRGFGESLIRLQRLDRPSGKVRPRFRRSAVEAKPGSPAAAAAAQTARDATGDDLGHVAIGRVLPTRHRQKIGGRAKEAKLARHRCRLSRTRADQRSHPGEGAQHFASFQTWSKIVIESLEKIVNLL